jgi:hypothetical protein
VGTLDNLILELKPMVLKPSPTIMNKAVSLFRENQDIILSKIRYYNRQLKKSESGNVKEYVDRLIDFLNSEDLEFGDNRIEFDYGRTGGADWGKYGFQGAAMYDDGTLEVSLSGGIFKLNRKTFEPFLNLLLQLFAHELVHKRQMGRIRKANKKLDNTNFMKFTNLKAVNTGRYMSDKHEIMAFARQSVEELRQLGFTKRGMLDLLSNPLSKRNKHFISSMKSNFAWYLFSLGVKHPSTKRMMKNMYQYIEERK